MGKVKEELLKQKEVDFERQWELLESRYTEVKEKQIGGSHYADMAFTPTQYILVNNIGWLEGNAIKYLSRHHAKNGKEDLEKAIHYCELAIKEYYE